MAMFSDPQNIVDGYMGANIAGNPVLLDKMMSVSVHAFCTATGSPDGYFTIEVSNETGNPIENGVATNINNWNTLVGPVLFTGATNYYWQGLIGAKWVRTVYTAVSGTGTLEVYLMNKSYSS